MADDTTTFSKRTTEEKKNWFLAQLLFFSAKYTLALLVVSTCCFLAMFQIPIEEKFMYLTYSIVGFYFGKETDRRKYEDKPDYSKPNITTS